MKKSKKNEKNITKYTIILVVTNALLIVAIFLLLISKSVPIVEKEYINVDNKHDLKNENIVFLGDSITDWYPFEEMYSNDIPIVNSGIAGYETKDILNRMDDLVYKFNPTKVFILIGTNDIKYEEDDEQVVVDNIKKIIKEIKKNRPNTKVYITSIFPVNRELKYHAAEERYNGEILKINKGIKNYCKENNITYINMYDELIDSKGNLKKEYTVDGLHLSKTGYVKYTSKLLQYIY